MENTLENLLTLAHKVHNDREETERRQSESHAASYRLLDELEAALQPIAAADFKLFKVSIRKHHPQTYHLYVDAGCYQVAEFHAGPDRHGRVYLWHGKLMYIDTASAVETIIALLEGHVRRLAGEEKVPF